MHKSLTFALAVLAVSLPSVASAQPATTPRQHGTTPITTATAPGHEQHEATLRAAQPGEAGAAHSADCNCCEMMGQMMAHMQAMMQRMHPAGQPDATQGMQHREPPAGPPTHQDHQPPQPD